MDFLSYNSFLKAKSYYTLRAYLYAATAIFILSVPLWAEITDNGFGLPFCLLMAAVFGYLSYSFFKKARGARDEDMSHAPPTDATAPQKIKFYTRFLYLSSVAFPLLTLIDILELNSLEPGVNKSVELWAPVAFLYNHYGYWPAVLSVPVLGLVVILGFVRKIRIVSGSLQK